MTLSRVSVAQAVSRPKTTTRAVVVQVSSNLRRTLAGFFPHVLDSGAGLFVALPREASVQRDHEVANYAIATIKRGVASKPIETFRAWLSQEAAETFANLAPGRAQNLALQINAPGAITPSHQTLLKRAFSDFDHIRLIELAGGLSGIGVWRVEASNRNGRSSVPFVVKAGDREKITKEMSTMAAFVTDYVPFPHYAPLVVDRCVDGATDALMVSLFVDRATRMDQYISEVPPRPVIAGLFDGPLRKWRGNRLRATVRLGDLYLTAGVVRDDAARLEESYQLAHMARPTVRAPQILIDVLRALPPQDVTLVYSHGDLHPRNMYVKQNSIDVILIDFARAGEDSPLSRDPARLDVALAFDVIEGLPAVDDGLVRALYTRPLLQFRPDAGADNRIDAIHQVRMQTRAEGADEREYEIAVVCHLLRFCGFPDWGVRRGLAYDLADLLL